MEYVKSIKILKKSSWFNKRCRSVVHSVFEKITYGKLEVVEGSNHYLYPDNANNDEINGKILTMFHLIGICTSSSPTIKS